MKNKAFLVQVYMHCCERVMLIASREPIYFSEYIAIAVRLSLVALAEQTRIEIVEGTGFAAVVHGEVPDDARFTRYRVTASGKWCSMYCDAVDNITEALLPRQRALMQSFPLGAPRPSETQ